MRPDKRRVVIRGCRPSVDGGERSAKVTVDLPFRIRAAAFADSHDALKVWARVGKPVARSPQPTTLPRGWIEVPLQHQGDDQWSAWATVSSVGDHAFDVVGCIDEFRSWLRDVTVKHAAGDNVASELEEGARMAEARLTSAPAPDREALASLAAGLRGPASVAERLDLAADSAALMDRTIDRSSATVSPLFPIWSDRPLGGFSAWYEMFPRSEGSEPGRSGTLEKAAQRLRNIAAMGFDVVYLPPIHPIGFTDRKGANNALAAAPGDPGSPWAIGSQDGGHTAVHPDLGTLADFDSFVAEAKRQGLEVALDYAVQCSPDHPWVSEHPDWFRQRPDGTIKYAENPPKKYHDVYPIDFNTADWRGLWDALRDVVLFWCDREVRAFRVDNPHTKPLPFWEWLIDETHQRFPDVVFLAEAFTRPAVMHELAKIGFTQSYTYFTWRNTSRELADYLSELSQTPAVDYFRPNFWTNTPDILHDTLQHGGPGAFRLRLVLAALCAPSWGMYSGYELYENAPLQAGGEEYLDSEKYQYRQRDWNRADSLAPFIALVGAIRRRHRDAVAQLDTLRVQGVDNDALICVSRTSPDLSDRLVVIVNLDPLRPQEAMVWLDLPALGIDESAPYDLHDELTGSVYRWRGASNYVRLDPQIAPAHVFHLVPT